MFNTNKIRFVTNQANGMRNPKTRELQTEGAASKGYFPAKL
jgi:hypothetical protein